MGQKYKRPYISGKFPYIKYGILKIKQPIRHVDKHNRPRRQTIYQINQRLSAALQHSIGEQLIACECAG
jgi:hypothetical protein